MSAIEDPDRDSVFSSKLGFYSMSDRAGAIYRRSGESFFTLPQIVVVLEAGDTVSPTGLMSG